MIDVASLKAVADVGGWVTLAVVLTAALGFILRAVKNGDLVAGSVHREVLAQNAKLAESVAGMTVAVNLLSQRFADSLRYPPTGRR